MYQKQNVTYAQDFYKKLRAVDESLKIIHQHLQYKQDKIHQILRQFIYYEKPTIIADTTNLLSKFNNIFPQNSAMSSRTNSPNTLKKSKPSVEQVKLQAQNRKLMEDGFVKSMRKAMRKKKAQQQREKRISMVINPNKSLTDGKQQQSFIQSILNAAKRQQNFSLPPISNTSTISRKDQSEYNFSQYNSQFESSFQCQDNPNKSYYQSIQKTKYSMMKTENEMFMSQTPQKNQLSSLFSPRSVTNNQKSRKKLSIYSLKLNNNPLANRLSGGQKVYLSQAYTINPSHSKRQKNPINLSQTHNRKDVITKEVLVLGQTQKHSRNFSISK